MVCRQNKTPRFRKILTVAKCFVASTAEWRLGHGSAGSPPPLRFYEQGWWRAEQGMVAVPEDCFMAGLGGIAAKMRL